MKSKNFVPFDKVKLYRGFWKDRYELNKNVSVAAVKARFEETGRFDALRFNHNETKKPLHVYFDSDAAKWIEGVAYLLKTDRESMKKEEAFIDELVDCMEKAQREDGYINSYFQQLAPDRVYTDRNCHELYCSGHLIEAAIAYHAATGKRKFLDVMEKNCECIDRAFFTEKTALFQTPGHEEIELALFKLREYTGKDKYREMAEKFISLRGNNDKDKPIYGEHKEKEIQDADVFSLKEATGHSVRALYLYSAMADMFSESGNPDLKKSLDNVWADITERKMYITGGVGSTHAFEGFTSPYDLQNDTAYSESCCAIAFCLFAMRMRKIERDAKYGALTEREFYNNLLSSSSLDGTAFFYTNPLEISLEDRYRTSTRECTEWYPESERQKVFDCSCCPPNITRFFAYFPELICFEEEDGASIEQYIACEAETSFGNVVIKGNYAAGEKMEIRSDAYTGKKVYFRVPEWCERFRVTLNGKKVFCSAVNGYIELEASGAFKANSIFACAPRLFLAIAR